MSGEDFYTRANAEVKEVETLKKKFVRRLDIEEERNLMQLYKDLTTLVNTHTNQKNISPLFLYYIVIKRQSIIKTFISCNMRLVISIAKRFVNRGLPIMDLVHEGIDGIVHTLEKFNTKKDIKFSTYATIWIEQRIRRAIENKARLVRLPNNKLLLISKIKGVYRRFKEKFDYAPTSEEIVEELKKLDPPVKLSIKEVEELGRMSRDEYTSLDEDVGSDENISMVNYITYDASYQPERLIETTSDKDYIQFMFDSLTIKDRNFIRLMYGFIDGSEKTPKQMSLLLKKPLKFIRETEERILGQMRNNGNAKRINCLSD